MDLELESLIDGRWILPKIFIVPHLHTTQLFTITGQICGIMGLPFINFLYQYGGAEGTAITNSAI